VGACRHIPPPPRDHPGAPRVRAGDEWPRPGAGEDSAVGPVEQLADALGGRGLLRGALGGDEQRSDFLGRERDLRQVVPLLGDRVPLLDVPDVGGLHLERDAVLAEDVLVALELPLGRVEIVAAVGREDPADLLEGHGMVGLEEQADQVEEPLERFHPVVARHRRAS
jgi:hypothetical protein